MSIQKNLEKLFSLENKVVLLTGASGGIGEEIAKGLASIGATMILCDLDINKLQTVEKKIVDDGYKAQSYSLDIANSTSIKDCVKEVIENNQKIDVLINCAGINKRELCTEVTESTYDKIMDVNLKGAFFLSQEVVKHMINSKAGSIINISSHNAVSMLGGCGVYGASKSGLTAITRAQCIELAPYGIRSNAIAPGHISTPLTAPLWTDKSRSQYLLDRIAMNRPGTPQDLLGIIVLLASDASSYMSGMMYHVDGGCLAGGQPWELS